LKETWRIGLIVAALSPISAAWAQQSPSYPAPLPISRLPAATLPLSGTEAVPLVQNGTTKQASIDSLFGNLPGGGSPANVTIPPYNLVGDGQTGTATLTSGSPSFSGVAAKPGQMFAVPGVGIGGGPFQTTVKSTNQLNAAPTYSTGTWFGYGEVCPVSTPGSGVNPNDTFSVGGAGYNAPTLCVVISTGVYAATVAAAGSGATVSDGTQCIVSGTTGNITGVKFSAVVVITGGGISSVVNTAYPGQYYGAGGNPTNPADEPVTSLTPGCNTLTGAALSLTIGVNRAWITQPGNANSQPAGPQTPTNIIGSGTGVVFAIPYQQSGQAWYGTDNLSAIKTFTGAAPAGYYYVPPGTYLMSCPPTAGYLNFANAVSLYGAPGQSTIQLSPWCVQPNTNQVFILNGFSGIRWSNITFDINNSVTTSPGFPYYNSMTRNVNSLVYLTGNGGDDIFDNVNFLNMRSGQIGLQGFWSSGQSFDHLTFQNSRCTENTTVGPINHCFYVGHATGGSLTNVNTLNNVSVGSNIAVEATKGTARDNDICCQGYGGALNISFGPLGLSYDVDVVNNKLHDANNGVEDGDGDIPTGGEDYDVNGLFEGNHIWNEPGPGLKLCAEHNRVIGNDIHDNGSAIGPNQASGSARWQLNAAIALMRLSNASACDTNGTLIVGNHGWDSYTWALANGQDTTGLSPTQYYGISENGVTQGELAKIFSGNDFGYNANNYSPTVGAAVISLTGAGYGSTLSGTMTWAGSNCSTNPVLGVKTNSAGIITTITGIINPGVCTALPPSSATTWTPGGGLSAGSGATFALTSPINSSGIAYTNGIETIDAVTAQSRQSISSYQWGELTVASGATAYFYGSAAVEANATLKANNGYAGQYRRLTVTQVLAPVVSPAVYTLYTAPSSNPGVVASPTMTCSVPIGQNTCSVDIPQTMTTSNVYVIQVVNGSTSGTGQVSIYFEFWRQQ
jgi:hypothetical protein